MNSSTGNVLYNSKCNINYWSKIRLLQKPEKGFHSCSLNFPVSRVRSTRERGKSVTMAENHWLGFAILISRHQILVAAKIIIYTLETASTRNVWYKFKCNINYWSKMQLLQKPENGFRSGSLIFPVSRVRSTSERGKSMTMA